MAVVAPGRLPTCSSRVVGTFASASSAAEVCCEWAELCPPGAENWPIDSGSTRDCAALPGLAGHAPFVLSTSFSTCFALCGEGKQALRHSMLT